MSLYHVENLDQEDAVEKYLRKGDKDVKKKPQFSK